MGGVRTRTKKIIVAALGVLGLTVVGLAYWMHSIQDQSKRRALSTISKVFQFTMIGHGGDLISQAVMTRSDLKALESVGDFSGRYDSYQVKRCVSALFGRPCLVEIRAIQRGRTFGFRFYVDGSEVIGVDVIES